MTCFWDGILNQLNTSDAQILGVTPRTPHKLKEKLQLLNRPPRCCKWQQRELSPQLVEENMEWIRVDNTHVSIGHDTSCCDPYLCLLVELLGVDIVHEYTGSTVCYTHVDSTCNSRVFRFKSDNGHFWSNK